jgi:branched-chain amino acid transport system ATP-binding protein
MTAPVIQVANLVAGYGGVSVLHGITLEVRPSQVVALLGANGAGKSTTLMSIAGAVTPTRGHVALNSVDVSKMRPHRIARLGLAFVPEDRGILFQLTVTENLRLRRQRNSTMSVDEVFELFPTLPALSNRKAGLLSGGEQQMLGIACALMTDPKALLLDELSHGLAPVIVEQLLPAVRDISRKKQLAVLLVEQHVADSLEVADYGYILNRGRVVASGPAAEFRNRRDLIEASYLGYGEIVDDTGAST